MRQEHHLDPAQPQAYARLIHSLHDLDSRLSVIDSAISYIKALLVAMHLWEQSMETVKSQPLEAVQRYLQLVKFVQLVTEQEVVQHSWRDLGDYLRQCQQQLWTNLDLILRENFEAKLGDLKWPVPLQPPYGPDIKAKVDAFEYCFNALLLLGASDTKEEGTLTVTPLQIMLAAIALRFRFHFEGSKPTNRLDKPEWYLKHIKTQIESHLPFLMTTVQPIMQRAGLSISAKDYFIDGLLKNVKRKVLRTIPKMLEHPQWFSHTVHELLQFDHDLQEDYGFQLQLPDGTSKADLVSDLVMEHEDWFDAWFSSERNFVQMRYDAMMADANAFELCEDDDQTMEISVTTYSALHLVQLLEGVLDTYKLIPHIQQQLHFFVRVQLGLLSFYHDRIESALGSFEARSLIRSVPVPGALPDAVTGVVTASETGGPLGVLPKLFRWWSSAKRVHDFIKTWEDKTFFLTLQASLEESPLVLSSLQHKVPASVDLSLLPNGLFTGVIQDYASLMDQTQQICTTILIKDWVHNTRVYTKSDQWWQAFDASEKEVSSSLYPALQELWLGLKYLHQQYPAHSFLQMFKAVSAGIEDHFWRNVMTKNQFSADGIQQLATDIQLGLWKVGQRVVKRPENYARRLKEALQLLTLSKEECREAMDRLTSKTTTLDQLGIDTLTTNEVRDVIRRRNDMLT
ncbi:hypothetical protein DM01DRAFT_1325062 [Hesseltinella vesiculosa]|uniref:RINT-1 family protein n=1 Tax=Hesseltinella vesiculosa TaxID=101127 RepID=A0A1X2GBN3_9FUNG|nr:hypothetical protein DM01DRAFT_1325062 [Hesseltinella vesiculosa]